MSKLWLIKISIQYKIFANKCQLLQGCKEYIIYFNRPASFSVGKVYSRNPALLKPPPLSPISLMVIPFWTRSATVRPNEFRVSLFVSVRVSAVL